MSTVSQELAAFVSTMASTEVDGRTRSKVDDLVADTVGCSVAAFASPPAKALRRAYGASTGRRSATIVGTDRGASVENAALINATMARYLDYNDCYMSANAACHPSDHIMALLSVAEAEGATGAEFVTAITLAYEIQARGMDACPVRPNGFDYVAWGAYSSVAAVGLLMGLSEAQLTDAFGIVGASNAPLYISRRGDLSMWKGVAHPYVTHNAIQACQMAEQGLTGPTAVFEGPSGFFEVVADGEVSFDAPPGDDPRVLETSIKSFACGYYIHSPVAGALALVEEHDLDPDAIDAIEIETFDHAVEALATPEKYASDLTRETADHSIPYTVAVAVIDGEVTPEQYAPERLSATDVHALMERIEVTARPSLTEHRTAHPRHIPSVTTIHAGETTVRRRVDCPLGHPENPLPRSDIERKFRTNCRGWLSDDRMQRCLDLCDDVADLDRLDPLLDTLVV